MLFCSHDLKFKLNITVVYSVRKHVVNTIIIIFLVHITSVVLVFSNDLSSLQIHSKNSRCIVFYTSKQYYSVYLQSLKNNVLWKLNNLLK